MDNDQVLTYKNCRGTVVYSDEDDCFYGEILGINSPFSYEGDSVEELEVDFHNAVVDYLETCNRIDENDIADSEYP